MKKYQMIFTSNNFIFFFCFCCYCVRSKSTEIAYFWWIFICWCKQILSLLFEIAILWDFYSLNTLIVELNQFWFLQICYGWFAIQSRITWRRRKFCYIHFLKVLISLLSVYCKGWSYFGLLSKVWTCLMNTKMIWTFTTTDRCNMQLPDGVGRLSRTFRVEFSTIFIQTQRLVLLLLSPPDVIILLSTNLCFAFSVKKNKPLVVWTFF